MPSNSSLKNTASSLPHRDHVLSPEILYMLRNCLSICFIQHQKKMVWTSAVGQHWGVPAGKMVSTRTAELRSRLFCWFVFWVGFFSVCCLVGF